MLPGEIAFLAFVVATFVVFGVTLAWVSHGDGKDHMAQPRRLAEHGPTTPISYQGADG